MTNSESLNSALPPPRILVVDDENPIREMINMALVRAGFQVEEAEDVRQAQAAIYANLPSLILLDWLLPEVSGVEFARRLKKDTLTREIPIIMLTAKVEESDKIRGLNVGADDYITKPFSPRELVARIKAVLRRTTGLANTENLQIGAININPTEHRVIVDNHEVHVSPIEFRMLHFLMTHPERVYNRGQLLDQVWGGNVYIEERTVDVHIRRLRKALAEHDCDHFIQTVRGVGYRFSTRESNVLANSA
ncbi:MAG: phosphate regulon transcriptional regulator PhoB [Pseudomonadota bacterium]